MSRTSPRLLSLLLAGLLLAATTPAGAELDAKAWRAVQEEFKQVFARRGEAGGKTSVLERLVQDGQPRAWKLIGDALVLEAEHWLDCERRVSEKVKQIGDVLTKPSSERYPADEDNLRQWQGELDALEEAARDERKILAEVTNLVAEGPEAVRKNLYGRARGGADWPVRAATARVAAVHPAEKTSFEFLSRALTADKDPRVRLAALEALGDVKEEESLATVENLVIGALGDAEWGVQVLAVRLLRERKSLAAIPHMINALERTSPRVGEAFGEALRELTGQNFDPYADVWAQWWEAHKSEFQSAERVRGGDHQRPPPDVTFYGLPIKSDRVLFIIDISSSMKLETKNDNPASRAPKGPVTPREGEGPPPPPPEEILSGPKIDVAKHELTKAVKKLPREAKFNIVAFKHSVHPWQAKMVDASDQNKEEAFKWIRQLEPSGTTYVDGALRTAFGMAGLGAVDKAYPTVEVDTIVVLSDGAPTDNNATKGALMDPELILQHVREWNAQKRIVVHAIGVDLIEGIEFLRKLAEENGGTYVDR